MYKQEFLLLKNVLLMGFYRFPYLNNHKY